MCDQVHIVSTLTTNEIWKSCIKYDIYLVNCGMQLSWHHAYFRHDVQMFSDAMNSFHIMLWYTYTCSNIKLNAIKLVLLKLIEMTTNAEYVAPSAEELKLNFQTEADLRFASYKVTHDINKSRENMLYERFLFVLFLFCFLL